MSKTKEEQEKNKEEWDKRKIILVSILVSVLLILGYSLKDYFLGSSSKNGQLISGQKVKGLSTQIDLRKNVQDQINNLSNEARSINLVDVASSSPQVQKVINDLKAIQNYQTNQIKDACMKICGNL
jgi:hypothetical protein